MARDSSEFSPPAVVNLPPTYTVPVLAAAKALTWPLTPDPACGPTAVIPLHDVIDRVATGRREASDSFYFLDENWKLMEIRMGFLWEVHILGWDSNQVRTQKSAAIL
jgi:hypothetical protein